MRRRFSVSEERRAVERTHAKAGRRLDKANQNLARDPFDPAFIVEHALARSQEMAARATARAMAAVRE